MGAQVQVTDVKIRFPSTTSTRKDLIDNFTTIFLRFQREFIIGIAIFVILLLVIIIIIIAICCCNKSQEDAAKENDKYLVDDSKVSDQLVKPLDEATPLDKPK